MTTDFYREWFEKKLLHARQTSLEPAIVSIKFRKPLGARGYYADVTLSAQRADTFSFVSKAEWKPFENYDEAVLDGVLTILFSVKSTPILGGLFILEKVGWHEVDSCYEAFFQASKQATQEILRKSGYWDYQP